jgi:HK97 gp10 family phage protein
MKVEMQLSGLAGVLETLKSLPPEVVAKRGGPVKLALKKGATVILKQAQANLERVTAGADDEGVRLSTGFLLKNLVATRGKEPRGTKGERYLVRVRRKRYPGRSGRGGASTLQTANLLEYGSSKQPAEPWLRPAFQAKAAEAIKTIETDLVKRLDAAVKKLAKQNAGKK